MAELNTGGGGGKEKKVRSKKQNSGVDLTAMVDLAFLLITFFMLTTSMNKPQSMNLAMPEKEDTEDPETETNVAESRTMTILLGENDKIVWYMGKVESPFEGPKDQVYGKGGIRVDIQSKVKSVPLTTGDPEKGVIVIIKPSEKSNYRNLVDILDEMAINDVKAYAISDIVPEELAMLGEN
ncbi:ExbD/TolR family protein [Myroides guanonis]|uniref:Outer membrane transport energization protein ExbD n=1 Tax=Myroides guanonis TaxID=1150112 RepID=A0A1I3SW45_9FLAO|nr:biopolymer transporter ExbD [Myroides guanonis]SFJ61686.1 outer membrane transport energization protein ExbD [Myroides guanonis]